MRFVTFVALVLLAVAAATAAAAQEQSKLVSLRLGDKEIALPLEAGERVAALARALLGRCGPNTALHRGNFGQSLGETEARWRRVLAGSRLAVAFNPPVRTESHLGGALSSTEAVIGLDQGELFVGPYFTRGDGGPVEHLQCEYLAALELACLRDLSPFMPVRYRETCARLERGADGRILLPPPDVAPSCS